MKPTAIARSFLLVGTMLGSATTAAVAGPDYSFVTSITVPVSAANNQGGNFTAFDISYVDPLTGFDYVADRSNAAVDIINGATNKVVSQAGVGIFGGQQATTAQSGPDGVVVVNNGTTATLFAGNGFTTLTPIPPKAPSSTLLSFNVTTPTSPTLLNTLSTGGINRVDEMAQSGTGNANPANNNLLLVANNAEPGPPGGSLPFATLVNATTGTIVAAKITIPNTPPPSAGGGLEQSVWNPKTQTFFVSVPAFNGAGNPGGIAEISPTGAVVASYDFGVLSGGSITSCSPTGLALGGSGNLMVGCGNAKSQTVLLNPTANGGKGAIVKTFAGVSGSDELYYDPASGDFFVTGDDATGTNRIFAVISDATDTLLQTVALPDVNAHSISVDPLNGEVFVPLEGSIVGGAQDLLCPIGCVAVFAQVPEPSALAILGFAVLGLGGASIWARRSARRS
jgi:PEP-CTERM motif